MQVIKNNDLPPEIAGFSHAQTIARRVAEAVSARLEPGVTEREVVSELESAMHREGARGWLHRPFAWFGERSGFFEFSSPFDFFPKDRPLAPGDVVTFDMAPVIDGYSADFGWSLCMGESPQYDRMKAFDDSFRRRLVEMLERRPTGRELVQETNQVIESAGYEVCHHKYPFGILGHRIERVRNWDRFAVGRPFELPTLALHVRQMVRGVNPLLNKWDRQPLEGVWALQPHVGNGDFGVKFEDLLWVHADGAQWLGQPELSGDESCAA